MERRLSTIMVADVAGYSALVREDEAETIRRVSLFGELLEEAASKYQGRVFNQAGDGFLTEFASPVSAVRCAHQLQMRLARPDTEAQLGFKVRVGIHLADVVVNGNDLLGDGVNVASRIEAEATPGRVLVSSAVFEHVKRSAQLRFENLGERHLKNIPEPVTVFAIVGEVGTHSCGTALVEGQTVGPVASRHRRANSLVVVPFKNASNDPEQDYIADGMTEDLITELSRFSDIFMISRNASFGLKDLDTSAVDLGKTFGVEFCLEGGVRKLGARIRINAYLTDTGTGEQVWTERADCALEEFFDVQDDLVARIVSSVAGQIERRAEASARRKRPGDLKAYDCFIRAMHYHRIGGVTKDNASQALHWFDEALKRDPNFGRAHAWRACAVATVAEWTGEDVRDQCVAAGRRALELDETDAESHRIAGSLALYEREFETAKYHFNRALELNPSHAFLVGRMGEVHNFLGDGKKALEYQRRAKSLDPLLPGYCRELEAVAYYVLNDYEACHRVVNEFTWPTRRGAAYRVAASLHLARPDSTQRAVRELLMIDPDFDPDQFVQTEFYRDRTVCESLKQELMEAIALVAEPTAA